MKNMNKLLIVTQSFLLFLFSCGEPLTEKNNVDKFKQIPISISFKDTIAVDSVTLVFEKYFKNDTLRYDCNGKTKILQTNLSVGTAFRLKLGASQLACPFYINSNRFEIPYSSLYKIIEINKEKDSLKLNYTNYHKTRY